jgi:apolipoprotein N-acyltransferase
VASGTNVTEETWDYSGYFVRRKEIRSHHVAACAGVVLALAAPPFDLYPALWVGVAGLAWSLDGDPRWPLFASRARVSLTGARRGLVFGAAANLVALRFVPGVVSAFTPLPWVVGLLGLLLLALFEGTRWMIAGIACETLVRARVPRPVALAAGVYAGTFLPTMLPWTIAGGVSPWPAMVQLADLVGERGVSALMALAAGLLAEGVRLVLHGHTRRRGALLLASAGATITAQALVGAARMHAVDASRDRAPRARVALVQPSIGASTRWEVERAPANLQELATLTREGESRGADLVVWPEAAYPYRLVHGTRREPDGPRAILPPGVHGPVLTGLLLAGPNDAAYNAAVLATREGGLSPSYDKRHLLWFGETVPLADRVPWMRSTFARGLGLVPGDQAVPFVAGRIHAAVLICYEDTLPDAGREAMATGPNLLVNLTNDAWFGDPENELHLRMSAVRAVELRRDFVRAVNLGVPSWFDAAGRLRARGSSAFANVLLTEPALLDGPPTLYTRFGDGPWALALLVLANAAVWRAGRRPGRH